MYWSNYHSHCTFCDGRGSMEEFIHFAIAKNIKNYGFSSHAPLPFLTKWTMLENDFPDYEKEFYRFKEKYKGEINIFLGLEIDYLEDCQQAIDDFIGDKNLDYRICSIHYLNKISGSQYWSIDGPFEEFDKGLNEFFDGDIKAAVHYYFQTVNKMIDKGGFDIIGHMDKISFHGHHYSDFDVKQGWYKNLLGETLHSIKEKGLILEINTKSLKNKDFTYPNAFFYPLIHELELPTVVNSDCHCPHVILEGIPQTFAELKKVGFKTLQDFRNDKWIAVEFNENGFIE